MPWKLVSLIAGIAKSVLSRLLKLIWNHPWPLTCVALLFLVHGLRNEKAEAIDQREAARTALTKEKDGRKADQADWARQVAAAIAAKKAAERQSQEIAIDAQNSHDGLAADNAGLRRFIAANRLRAESHPAAAAVATDDLGAAIPDAAATDAFVATSEADLVTCDALYGYARPAYEWAQALIAKGLAASPNP